MTAYVTATGSQTNNRNKYKPHDKGIVRIAKNSHNAAATAVPAGQVVNMLSIPANSIILGVWGMVAVDSAKADQELDIGLYNNGSSEFGAKVETNAAAGTQAALECVKNVHWNKSATTIGLEAANSLAWNAGTYTVVAAWIELDDLAVSN